MEKACAGNRGGRRTPDDRRVRVGQHGGRKQALRPAERHDLGKRDHLDDSTGFDD